ncbi:diaminopimelate epimerase, partial [Limnohabitans sp.]|uniref:diaminopimelate epimerase n=1 Tax=Limnohabitans sp. TaxID=1907725 RepID=UPI0037BF5F0D
SVRPSPAPGLDFEYVIHNADGGEVEHCGNGARCFVRYVRDKGLTEKTTVRVKVQHGEIELTMNPDGRVTVNMGAPIFDWERVPFIPVGLISDQVNGWPVFDLALGDLGIAPSTARVGVVSMGNPHAVQRVDDVDSFPVLAQGPLIENHPAFPKRVNAGFMQIVSRSQIKLRVFERGTGETLACGTGACAAVVAGIRQGWLDPRVDVQTHGGPLTIEWAGQPESPVLMTGPATSVFEGSIDVPDSL